MSARRAQVSPWAPFEDRRRARDEKKHAVLRTAAQLFLDVGYHRATLNDVATRLNITKPALYNYFRSKEEILDECYRLGQQMAEEAIAAIDEEGGDGLTRLRKLIRAYALLMTIDFGMCLVRLDDRELSGDAYRRVRAEKRQDDLAFRRYIEAGVADGSIVKCDPKLAAFVIAGSLNWIGHWYREGGAYSADEIADHFARLLTTGLEARRTRGRGQSGKDGRANSRTQARARRKPAPGGEGR
ncbi:MAG TPA: TetR/AcrR family transcriptional regulator [Rhodoblastus sp.]|nr:TetR/AcrR family transcriptional regulator [Rhodoblastus sp.]